MNLSIYLTGMMMGLSLLVAIGAQNAFVLRQGLRHEYVFVVCLTCAVSDAILVSIGVTSFGQIVLHLPWLEAVMRYAGAAFLCFYGLKSLLAAWHASSGLTVDTQASSNLSKVLGTCLALTWLNPHVYLDTVVLLGAVSTRYVGEFWSFASGAITASFAFFFLLGYGARWLRPVFAKPLSWRILDIGIALVMWRIAFQLMHGL